jgi:hypothetical protein
MVKQKDIIRQCYINLTDAMEKYQDIWMCDETWVRVINARYPNVINSVGFLRATFNCVIRRHAPECGTHNALDIFVHHFSMSCPYDSDVSHLERYCTDVLLACLTKVRR